MDKLRKITVYVLILLFTVFTLVQAVPNAGADTQSGFILASPGKDGQWGTNDDIAATEKGEAIKGAVDTTQYKLTNSIPSNLQIGKIVLSADKTSVPADGKTAITIQAIGYDKYGNLLPDGTVINFSTDFGNLSSSKATMLNGTASVIITSTTPGTAIITAFYGNMTSKISVNFTSIEQIVNPNLYIFSDDTTTDTTTYGTTRYSASWSPPSGWKMTSAYLYGNTGYELYNGHLYYMPVAVFYLQGLVGSNWIDLAKISGYGEIGSWINIPDNVTKIRIKVYETTNSSYKYYASVSQVKIQMVTK